MADDTYPTAPALTEGSGATDMDATHYNYFRNNINAIANDLIAAWADGQDFPGVDYTALQASNMQEALEGIRHMLDRVIGLTNWFDDPSVSLETLADGPIVLHPQYPGAVRTNSLRGADPSWNNTVTEVTGSDFVSNIARNYYENSSSETNLQDSYVALRWTLPPNFTSWAASYAIQIEFKTESGTSINCHVDVYVYESGNATLVDSSENNTNTGWSTITLDNSDLDSAHTWAAGDIIEIFLKLETRNDYFARVGSITFNYDS